MITQPTTRGECLRIVTGPLGIPQIRATAAPAEPVHDLTDAHHPAHCPACIAARPKALPPGSEPMGVA